MTEKITRQVRRQLERTRSKAGRTARSARSVAAAIALAGSTLLASPAAPPADAAFLQRLNEPEVSCQNFNAAKHELKLGESVIKLTDYQLKAIQDKSRIAIFKWCRQAGKDFTASLIAVLDALETGNNWYIVSLTQRQALATAKKAQQHARAIGAAVGDLQEKQYKDKDGFVQTSYGVRLPNGAEIVALPGKDPDALAGLTGNVIFTEMALFPNGGKDHWRVVFPLATRGFRILAISTPRGPDTKFAELCRNPKGKYSVHVVDIHAAVAGGLDLRDETGAKITPDELQDLYNDPSGWDREYMCLEGEDWDPLISWEHIHACQAKYAVERLHIEGMAGLEEILTDKIAPMIARLKAAATGTRVFGYDIAVTGDLAAIPVGERIGDVVWTRGLITMHKVDDFEFQRKVVRTLLRAGFRGVGDASGLGRDTCQQLEKEFTQFQFKGVVFTTDSKAALCVQGMQMFQAVKVRISAEDLETQYDFHALAKKEVGVAKRLQVVANRNPLLRFSHCDIAMGSFMMFDAAVNAGDAYFRPEAFEPTGTDGEGVF
jgi:phage FluMu gp28-like protein